MLEALQAVLDVTAAPEGFAAARTIPEYRFGFGDVGWDVSERFGAIDLTEGHVAFRATSEHELGGG